MFTTSYVIVSSSSTNASIVCGVLIYFYLAQPPLSRFLSWITVVIKDLSASTSNFLRRIPLALPVIPSRVIFVNFNNFPLIQNSAITLCIEHIPFYFVIGLLEVNEGYQHPKFILQNIWSITNLPLLNPFGYSPMTLSIFGNILFLNTLYLRYNSAIPYN